MFAQKRLVVFWSRWHPVAPEVDSLGPGFKGLNVFRPNEVASTVEPNFAVVDIGRINIRRQTLLPFHVALHIYPARPIVGVRDRNQVFDSRQIIGATHPITRANGFSPVNVGLRAPPALAMTVPRSPTEHRPQGARWIDIAVAALPRTLVNATGLILPVLLGVLKVVGNERHDLVVCDPLVLLTDPFDLWRVMIVIANVKPIEIPKALGCPPEVKHSPKYVALDYAEVKSPRQRSFALFVLQFPDSQKAHSMFRCEASEKHSFSAVHISERRQIGVIARIHCIVYFRSANVIAKVIVLLICVIQGIQI